MFSNVPWLRIVTARATLEASFLDPHTSEKPAAFDFGYICHRCYRPHQKGNRALFPLAFRAIAWGLFVSSSIRFSNTSTCMLACSLVRDSSAYEVNIVCSIVHDTVREGGGKLRCIITESSVEPLCRVFWYPTSRETFLVTPLISTLSLERQVCQSSN